MQSRISSPAPMPARTTRPVRPVFLPGIGCPTRCIYCNQREQTGSSTRSLARIHAKLARELQDSWRENRPPFELAFFGGTFTQLPTDWQFKFLELCSRYKHKGLISRVRCSTRPDSCSQHLLQQLADAGLNTVEIGAQTFNSQVLQTCNRGYGPEAIFEAKNNVRRSGLQLGIQLLPGLPGHDLRTWLLDIRQTCSLQPDFARIYPCLVLKGTPLHDMYQNSLFQPWSLQQTISGLSRAFLRFWMSGIVVVRMGLHPEPSLKAATVAGPWHSSLGSLVRSRVLFTIIKMLALQLPRGPKTLFCPKQLQGELWGHKGKNKASLERLGVTSDRIVYTNSQHLELVSMQPRSSMHPLTGTNLAPAKDGDTDQDKECADPGQKTRTTKQSRV